MSGERCTRDMWGPGWYRARVCNRPAIETGKDGPRCGIHSAAAVQKRREQSQMLYEKRAARHDQIPNYIKALERALKDLCYTQSARDLVWNHPRLTEARAEEILRLVSEEPQPPDNAKGPRRDP